MKPALRFAEFQPMDDPGCVWIEFEVGPLGEEGGDLFQLLACTPDWLIGEVERSGARWGRALLIVPRIQSDEIVNQIESQLSRLSASTWIELATKISRIAIWEFEDYVEHGS